MHLPNRVAKILVRNATPVTKVIRAMEEAKISGNGPLGIIAFIEQYHSISNLFFLF
jgi:hypothetical protein